MLSKVVLRNKDKDGKSTVYIQYINNEDSLRINTKIKALPEHFKDGRLTKGYNPKTYQVDNIHIESMQRNVDDIVLNYHKDFGIAPDLHFVKEQFYREANAKKDNHKTFFQYFDEYINYKKQTNAPNTARNIEGCYNYLKRFEKETKYILTFDNINHKFFTEYRLFSIKDKRQNSSIAHTLNLLNGFIKYCIEREFTKVNNVPSFKITAKKNQNDVIALSSDEMIKVRHLDLKNPGEAYVRDLFILMCSTSLRFSDAIRLNSSKIKNGFIDTDINKTKDRVRIPLNPISHEILARYNNNIQPIDLGYFNKTIKKICEKIESLHEEVQLIKNIGSTKKVEVFKKYKLIAAHTGRRTFITNCITTGIPVSTIMKWTNHKKMDVFLKYVNKGVNEIDFMNKAFAIN
jgi:site-specific recombinase XerD